MKSEGARGVRGPQPTTTSIAAGRAGRNLWQAIVVGLALGGALLVSLFIAKPAFVVLTVVAVAIGVWELDAALRRIDLHLATPLLAVASACVLTATYEYGAPGLALGVVASILAVLTWHAVQRGEGQAKTRNATASLLALAYLPLLSGFAVLMLRADDGAQRIVVFVLLVVCNDVGGYATGVLWGKHPIAPSVSPKKSWEGAAGSLVFCAVGGAIAVPALLDGPWWAGVVTGACATLTATSGDFAESALKRSLGVKDMSALLPGHGGVLDRLDSLLATVPFAYLLLTWLVP